MNRSSKRERSRGQVRHGGVSGFSEEFNIVPIGPHRTSTQPVNVRDLERVFDDGAEVTLDAMVEKGLVAAPRHARHAAPACAP